MHDLKVCVRQGERDIRLKDLNHIKLATYQCVKILLHAAVCDTIELSGVDASIAQILL
jgi:hypothetical protein